MTGTKRGFSRERHTSMKLAITAASIAAFVVTWIGFSTSHGSAASTSPPSPTALPPTPIATATTSRGTRTTPPQATPTPQRAAPTPVPVTRPRTSRGS